jgi:putative ABC transport system permease protein
VRDACAGHDESSRRQHIWASLRPDRIGLASIRLDSSALLFTLAASLVTSLLFGLAPAWQGSHAEVTSALKNGGAQPSGFSGIRVLTGKSALVVVELSLAVVLLVGAGLMIKSFGRLTATRSGVDPDNVLTVRISVPRAASAGGAALAFFSQLEKNVAGLPSVLSAGMSNCHALASGCMGTLIWFRDRPEVACGTEPLVGVHFVSPDYFRTMKVPLLQGRWFTEADRQGSAKVVLISDLAARRFWPGENPLGKPIGLGVNDFSARAEVVGIVGDVRYGQVDEPPKPDVYIPYLQSTPNTLVLFARTAGNPTALTQAVRQTVHSLNRDLPVYDIKKTMDKRISDTTARARFSAILLAVFAAIALALAAVGIYGVMSYLVTQRTREIGIRIALGARSEDVLWLVTRRGVALALAGIAFGIAGALASTRVLATLLYEVKPGDPATYIVIPVGLAVVALLASYIPARRATRVDPSLALRAD